MPTRPATAADIPHLLPMVAALVEQHEAWDPERYGALPDVLDRYARWLPQRAADPRSLLLVAEADAPPPAAASPTPLAGFLVATVEPNIPIYRRAEFGFIHDLWVDPPHRRRGHATALLRHALAAFAAMGVAQVRLETAAANEPARRLFASLGFRVGTIDMLRALTPDDRKDSH